MASPLAPDDFYDYRIPTQVAVSPGGDRVAFVVDEFDPDEDERRRSLFVVPADGSREPHRLTRASDAGQPKWGPDGDRLAFVAAREDDVERSVGRDEDEEGSKSGEGDDEESEDEEGSESGEGDDEDGDESENGSGGENGPGDEPKPQVWMFDLARGGDARQVTDFEEGAGGFDWGPDGDRIAVGARDPTDDQKEHLEERREGGPIEVERLQHKADGVGFTDEVTTYLFVVDVASGESTRLDDAYAQGARAPLFGLQPAWGPGDRIAFGSNRTENPDDSEVIDLYTIDPDGEDLRRVTDSDLRADRYEWSPDGERVAFVGGDPYNWYAPSEVYVAEGAGEYRSVSASLDRTVPFAGRPRWVDHDTLVTAVGDEGWTRLVRLDADRDAPGRVFEGLGRDRTVAQFDARGDTVAVTVSDPAAGRDLFAADAGDLAADASGVATDEDPSTRLTALNDDLLSDAETPESRRLTWENADGVEIEGFLSLPAGIDPDELADGADDPLPLIVSIHGGPMAYDDPGFHFVRAYWTGQGYAVLRVNYRGSTSYGREFAERLKGTRGDKEVEDVESGVDCLVDRGWVDPDRTFVTGFSYGGITTANAVTRTDRFAAAAAEHGIYDFRSTFGTDDNHLWHDWEFGLPWENPETYEEISSITEVDRVDTPLLVTAGEEDWRCPPTQAEQLYVSVRKQGVPAKLVIYQDENHNVGDPDRAIHRIETLTEWFREHDPGVETDDGNGGSEERSVGE